MSWVPDIDIDVSRETMARLHQLTALLVKWNQKINLVARSTLDDVWQRHIQDSLQLWGLAPKTAETWLDLGSGGGFPGLVIAIVAAEKAPALKVTLLESDQRKCAFLRSVLRETGVVATVIASRIEAAPPASADIISARALADLPSLLSMVDHHGHQRTTALFPKGATWEQEVTDARKAWDFYVEPIKSKTEPKAIVLKIQGVSRV